MRRRALLGAVGTSVTAGCLGDVLHLSRGESGFSIENDPVPADFPATLSARLLSDETAAHPPRIRVDFEYTGDEPRTVRFNYPGPFADTLAAGPDGSKLVLEYEAERGSHHDGCWWTTPSTGRGATEHRRFSSGDEAHVEWDVLTHEESDTCYPSGRYRFVDRYYVDDSTYEWGFRLRIR
ncbi:hypothetical protein V5735_16215 (plasmid) [Haladaptatus sp. SPP-AMP-3]|uniref:hypothetical protein n=1 Tax=Haladaptatus sp. SPP-AMP-3 TaxID=3121295 RepID=UPI003C2F8034